MTDINTISSKTVSASSKHGLNALGRNINYYSMTDEPTSETTSSDYATTIVEGVDIVVINQDMCGSSPHKRVDTARMQVPGAVSVLDLVRLSWAASVLSFDATYQIERLWWETPEETLTCAKATIADLKAEATPNTMAYGSCDKVIQGLSMIYDEATRTLTIDPGLEG